MRTNHVRRRLEAGEPSVGCWLSLPSPEATEQVGRLGFDWVVGDMEHNPIEIDTLARMFAALGPTSTAPMVRIPWNTPEHFKRVIDAGAWGVVVPMVNGREEAEAAVRATRYPPNGARSVGGGRHALQWDAASPAEYYERANAEVLLVLQIEHIEGVQHADEILAVPGVDACFIGPNDLSASMGLGLGAGYDSDEPRVVEAIEHVREACTRHGVASGIHCSGADGVNRRIAQGFRFCGMSSELRYMTSALSADIARLNWRAARGREEAHR